MSSIFILNMIRSHLTGDRHKCARQEEHAAQRLQQWRSVAVLTCPLFSRGASAPPLTISLSLLSLPSILPHSLSRFFMICFLLQCCNVANININLKPSGLLIIKEQYLLFTPSLTLLLFFFPLKATLTHFSSFLNFVQVNAAVDEKNYISCSALKRNTINGDHQHCCIFWQNILQNVHSF